MDNGNYQEINRYSYNGNKLIKIETFENYLRRYKKVSYRYKAQNTYSVDSSFSIDNGGLSRIHLFKYLDTLLVQKIDSTIKRNPVTNKTCFAYNKYGHLIQKKLYGKFNQKDTLYSVFNVKYDDNQNIISKSHLYMNSLNWERNYAYDKLGHLTYFSYGGEKPVVEVFKKYYTSGQIIESKAISYTCIYCEDGMDSETAKTYPRIEITKYNEIGKPIEELHYISQNILKERIIYRYNNSQLVSINHFKDGIEIRKKELRYDLNGNLIFEHDQSFPKENYFDTQEEHSYEFYK